MKILFVSGYSFDVIEPKGITSEGVDFLAKPFTSQALAAKIRGMLGVVSPSVVERRRKAVALPGKDGGRLGYSP